MPLVLELELPFCLISVVVFLDVDEDIVEKSQLNNLLVFIPIKS